MPNLTVSDFSYIAVGAGERKIKRVGSKQGKPPYSFERDFYLPIRRAIVGLFKQNRTFDHLVDVAKRGSDKRSPHYRTVANRFIEWARGKQIHHYDPPQGVYQYSETVISCKPQLYYKVDGRDALIHLHFSGSEPMSQQRANYICFLNSETCNVPIENCMVLDLHDNREWWFSDDADEYDEKIQKEIRFIERNWEEESQ